MAEPISETAHYVAVNREGGTDLYLYQEGRCDPSAAVPILWDRRAERDASGSAVGSGSRLGAARRRAVRILSSVFSLVVLVLI